MITREYESKYLSRVSTAAIYNMRIDKLINY